MRTIPFAGLFVLFLAVMPVTLEAVFCSANWHSYESKCYRIFPTQEDSFTSELFCMLIGGKLASISSQGILEFLTAKSNPNNETSYWVGLQMINRTLSWLDGVPATNQAWVAQQSMTISSGLLLCATFDNVRGTVINTPCITRHGVICSRNKSSFDPTENCKSNLTQHSFIGEETGRCVYRLSVSTQKANVDSKCAESGGQFLNLDSIMRDGLNAFHEHGVMTNDGLKYWTALTWNGSHVFWEPGEVVQEHFPLIPGSGSCVTVAFNFTNQLEAHLYQTECTDQAYIICGSSLGSPTTVLPPTTNPTTDQTLYCPQGHNWKPSTVTADCFWETSYETNRMSWDDARSYCKGFGGDLASFHSIREEKIGLSFQYGSLDHPYWIGLKLDPDTESYKWADGSPLDYENWAPNHPDHKDKRLRCVAMDAKSKHWISSLCGIISWFVCKAPKRAVAFEAIIPTRSPLTSCNDDSLLSNSFYFQGYCYSVVNTQFNWHRAKQYCENEGSSLVSVHSDEEIGFLIRMLYDDRDTKGNRVWIGLNSLTNGIFRWTDWSPLDFTYWNENEPNNYQNQEKCCNMYMGNGLWNDENCNTQMGFICKQVKNATATPEIQTTKNPLLGNCKKGWYAYRDRCYLLKGASAKDRLNWTEALDFCTNQGGYVTSIRDSKEQAFLAYLMQDLKEDTWIGLHDTIDSGKYYWVDNSEMKYTNWAPGEPSFFGIQEDCVKMVYASVKSGVWQDDECSNKLPFICQMEKDPNIPKPPYDRSNECIHPEGWIKLGQLCFKMFGGNPMTWEEAETSCKRDGAHLISFTGTDVLAVANYLAHEVNKTYWIGLQINAESQRFSWLNEWPVTVTMWNKNEPGSFDKNLCYVSTFDGFWERHPCSEQLPYICQITTGKAPFTKQYMGKCRQTSDEWKPTDGNFCIISDNVRLDWYSAFLKCYAYGSYLVSLHSFEDLKILKAAISKDIPSVFLGFRKNENGGFAWSDGTPVDFVNWDLGEPENEDERCVEMLMDTLKWRVVSCASTRHFICLSKKDKKVDIIPENEKLIADSTNVLSIGALVGILVVFLFIAAVIVGVYIFRGSLGKSRFRIPFMQQSMSFENALYNAETTSMEFQETGFESHNSR